MHTEPSSTTGRPRSYDPEEAIEKAAQLFWQRGYDTASMTELLQAMGIGKGSFYLSYPGGKKELFEKILHRQGEKLVQTLADEIRLDKNPLEGIKNFFRNLAVQAPESWPNGCFVSNTLVEQTNRDTPLRQQAQLWFDKLEKEFASALKKAQKKGIMEKKGKTKVLARYLISTWHGLQVSRRALTTKKDLSKIIELHLSVLH